MGNYPPTEHELCFVSLSTFRQSASLCAHLTSIGAKVFLDVQRGEGPPLIRQRLSERWGFMDI